LAPPTIAWYLVWSSLSRMRSMRASPITMIMVLIRLPLGDFSICDENPGC
jgi:hypothetical protein